MLLYIFDYTKKIDVKTIVKISFTLCKICILRDVFSKVFFHPPMNNDDFSCARILFSRGKHNRRRCKHELIIRYTQTGIKSEIKKGAPSRVGSRSLPDSFARVMQFCDSSSSAFLRSLRATVPAKRTFDACALQFLKCND